MDPGAGSSNRIPGLTFSQLENGYFQRNPSFSAVHPSYLTSNYDETLFYDGKPIFRFRKDTNPIAEYKLQQAFADFGGFHAQVSGSNRVISIAKHPSNPEIAALEAPAASDVVAGVMRAEQTGRTFGRNAASIAHGWGASTVPMRRGRFGRSKPARSPPSWEVIHASTPSDGNADLRYLRQQRDENRFMRFINDAGTLSLGISANAEGKIQHQHFDIHNGRVLFHGF
ncbi:uncharacterized protein UTRI_04540 [Ustilago trichophora]|uniref:Uncharacterized protein n=1 Tax=Ustilago trichophora TaxID=86804 RepID=A0A5C3EDT6_9BASI|nr:uncharacterized protein UTRI_04540 [Ustilago trichophora]